jgi:AraC-like DNA-binding protein
MSVLAGDLAEWRRVAPVPGHVLDLLHARVAVPFAPHLHEQFAIGACTDGVEAIRYRGELHYSGPGSVVVLEPGETHTGAPASGVPHFTYRVMYAAAGLLSDQPPGNGLPGESRPSFREPVIVDPGLAAGLRRVHAALSRGTDPFEAESRLSWMLGELIRRHGSPAGAGTRVAGPVARQVMTRLADQLTCPPALAELAAERGLSRYQLVRSFRDEVGMPPYAWLAQYRVARARTLLEQGHRPAEVSALAGFADQAHLTRWFRRVVGVTPALYRNSVQDTAPRYR